MDKPTRKTSFRLDNDLLKQAAHYAIDHETTLTDMIEEGLRRVMKEGRNRGN